MADTPSKTWQSVRTRVGWFWLAALLGCITNDPAGEVPNSGGAGVAVEPWNQQVAQKFAPLLDNLGEPTTHYAELTEEQVRYGRLQAEFYEILRKDQAAGGWFAALVETNTPSSQIAKRFPTWSDLVEFLAEKNALVEVWAPGVAGSGPLRRVTARELAEWKRQPSEPPFVITVTYPESDSGKLTVCRLEFGLTSAAMVLEAQRADLHQRSLRTKVNEILDAKNDEGRPDAFAQWKMLESCEQDLRPDSLPPPPWYSKDLFVAVEYSAESQGRPGRVVAFYRESQIRKSVRDGEQVLLLRRGAETNLVEAAGFVADPVSGELRRISNPVRGQDMVELRVADPSKENPRALNVVEFGEAALLKESALARFSLLNALLERHRKRRAVTQANLAIVSEPIIAALNIGGGIAGLGFPAGEAGRLLYNLITWRLISDVPTPRQMRELFALMAARDADPKVKVVPERLLTSADIASLKEAGRKLSDQEVRTFLERMSNEDIEAMLRLARMGMLDARVTTFLNTLTSAFKVSGVADEPGAVRDIFNNVYFSLNGDINLSTILLVALGKEEFTAKSGVSLEELSHGDGPWQAWFQYLVLSVDIRALVNTIARWMHRTEADKELKKPFPYAPRLSDLAAYEVRVFGFPLLLFYKRGLTKADLAAFENDYAYGLLGASLVEHFSTREEMEAEVRAGRMYPLGLVRVRTTEGWKDTDLVVYAHRIPGGRHKGKTSLVIYGLKAYQENSELMAREILRFRLMQQGIREGAVIEQRLPDTGSGAAASLALEPTIHAGSNVIEQLYSPLLADLIELRRHDLRRSWGLSEEPEFARVRQKLEEADIRAEQGDGLVSLDPRNGGFVYRRTRNGKRETVRMTSISGMREVEREMKKADEAKRIEELRRAAATGENAGIVLLNEIRDIAGRLEVGPLLRGTNGEVLGTGVRCGAPALEEVLARIEKLPIVEQVRLQANHFAATVLELNGQGTQTQRVFLTIEFPSGEVRRERTNPVTGESEVLAFRNGLLRSRVTDRRILEIEYDSGGIETRSRLFLNQVNRHEASPGRLLEETRTLEFWHRDLSRPGLDPYAPLLAKLRVNFVTGELTRETYGLFAHPVEVADGRFVTRNRFTTAGVFESAIVFENEADNALASIPGKPRFQLKATAASEQAGETRHATPHQTVIERTDLAKNLRRTEVLDGAKLGRKVSENWVDPFDGSTSFACRVHWEYSADFFCGEVPIRASLSDPVSNRNLSESTTIRYDPVSRQLTARELLHTGKTQTNTWDWRWSSPVLVETAERTTTNHYNRDETTFQSTVLTRDTGEVLSEASGSFDAQGAMWQVTRKAWYQPTILNHTETNTLSAYGRLIVSRPGGALEIRPVYSSDGVEESVRTFLVGSGSGKETQPCTVEDDYQWSLGARETRIRVFMGGSAWDSYRVRRDAEGRVVESGIRNWPGLETRSASSYDGASERILKTTTFQNGTIRITEELVGNTISADGALLVKTRISPAWGLTGTNFYRIGDPLGRIVETRLENGALRKAKGWVPGTSAALETEVLDRQGQMKERVRTDFRVGNWMGIPYDLAVSSRGSPWGQSIEVNAVAVASGTGVPLFVERAGERIVFDLAKPFEAPVYAIALQGRPGIEVRVQGTVRSNLSALFSTRLSEATLAGSQEPQLHETRISFEGFFSHSVSWRTLDRAGSLLEEASGRLRTGGAQPYSDTVLLDGVRRATAQQKTLYRFDPGWLEGGVNQGNGNRSFTFRPGTATNTSATRVNDARWREVPSEVLTYRARENNLTPDSSNQTGLFLAKRLYQPRFIEANPFLPGLTNVWLSWSVTDFAEDGRQLYESEYVFDTEGNLSTSVARKTNGRGEAANKVVYQLPRPPSSSWRQLQPRTSNSQFRLELGGPENLAGVDFIAFFLAAPLRTNPVVLEARDRDGHIVTVKNGPATEPRSVRFWPLESPSVQWLPDEVLPMRGSMLTLSDEARRNHDAFAISVAELAGAGLDVREVSSLDLVLERPEPEPLRVTTLYKAFSGDGRVWDKSSRAPVHSWQKHSNGLEVHRLTKANPTAHEQQTRQGWEARVFSDGVEVATIYPRNQPPYYPVLLLRDTSLSDVPRPVYALSAEGGQFLEHYYTTRPGDTRIYAAVSGFEAPRLEVFRAGILEDEISPGIFAFGHGYYVTVPMARGRGGIAQWVAELHNRCEASAFALAGETLFGAALAVEGVQPELRSMAERQSSAGVQVKAINQLPLLAEALLPRRPVPWFNPAPGSIDPAPAAVSTQAVKAELYRLRGLGLGTKTQLLPTAPDTAAARYVDTSDEAEIIEILVQSAGMPGLAAELLSFYWEVSQGGTEPLHSSYDAVTGASLEKLPRYPRASDAGAPARSQLAMAQAAFCLGHATGDQNALVFGSNLVHLVLTRYRDQGGDSNGPRGIAEHPVVSPAQRFGLTLWPKAKAFSVGSNARAYLLFRRLAEQADRYSFGREWQQTMADAAGQQADWLRQRIMPSAQATGVVTRGMFEIQEVKSQTASLALEKWTTTEDWLDFIEAADRMGIDRTTVESWLENLARCHGTQIGDIWGLDWMIPLQRGDAISPKLTAKFYRLAGLLGVRDATAFAWRNVVALRRDGQWPAVYTAGFPDSPLERSTASPAYPVRTQPGGWPIDVAVHKEFASGDWPIGLKSGNRVTSIRAPARDTTWFFQNAAAFYLAILAVTLFWWLLGMVRTRRRAQAREGTTAGQMVPEPVLQQAEKRWAERVLGAQFPAGAERSRYSNGAVEQNFHMQLRAIYKLTLEWRRMVNDWSEEEPRLVQDAEDPWLNGIDEFGAMLGVYTRWVIKAGRKDGGPQKDVLLENEDSNHIWGRLVMYFSEPHARLLHLLREYKANPAAADILGVNDQIELVLRTMGVRARSEPFDARRAFDAPANPEALDLLLIQLPGANLRKLAEEFEKKLGIPVDHFVAFVRNYKSFKRRELLLPIHPYVVEGAKILPHFLLMALVGLIWYNNDLGGLRIYPYLRGLVSGMALDWRSLIWFLPLASGVALAAFSGSLRVYRYRWGPGASRRNRLTLDVELTSLVRGGAEVATPAMRTGRWWDPLLYQRAGWILRAIGLGLLAWALLRLEAPSFATFLSVKMVFGPILIIESACLLLPLIFSFLATRLEDYVAAHPHPPGLLRFLNQLNLVPTRPASMVGLSIKYHFQPSRPTGSAGSMVLSIVFYFVFAAAFFAVGSYMFKQALEVWFQEAYRMKRDVSLVLGTFVFWNTMYLLRFGLFVLFAALASAIRVYPIRVVLGLAGAAFLGFELFFGPVQALVVRYAPLSFGVAFAVMLLMAYEPEILKLLARFPWASGRRQDAQTSCRRGLDLWKSDPNNALAVVYMSGDELSYLKLTPELLVSRARILRDKLGSGGLALAWELTRLKDDQGLAEGFGALHALEKRHQVTLWHPMQLVSPEEPGRLREELGLNLHLEDGGQREPILAAWHLRRWLVTMMSTAGHSQDTAINLVDFALALEREGLAANSAFFLIQNKYDNESHNRPSQACYERGELDQRNKLARLLMEVAPGCRAYSINDWTPFGFKAGGLVGMDLVHEESLKVTNMLVLDRNANAHDLDAVMEDIKTAVSDPGVVNVIPGRSTTNTLTPIGQGSQLIEEGHRAFVRGVAAFGGGGAEALGTGWGNIQAVYYGRVQRALCNANTSLMPLTTSAQRSATFGERCEGLIGFGPHAIGISEDIWGVTQAAHNALALGYRISFRQSRALWHKIRETWSHAEWFAAFPRWAGGYVQMMLDPLMQQINDFGPASVFAKELRAGGGRFFLSAPFALLSIALMPLAVIWDFSPFVQILILLWNLGLVMNQVLTTLGLVACLEGTGFSRVGACAGVAVSGFLTWALPGSAPFWAATTTLGFVTGGFAMGLGRWLYYRARDIMLFGPQLVIHVMGQVVRQSLEFILSGASANDAQAVNIAYRAWAGPREDQPLARYQNFVNLRTVVWGAGAALLLLNLFALAHLDFLNILLLLPSLMFSVSTLAGPFLMQPKPGRDLGLFVWIPKSLGWIASAALYVVIARLIAHGGLPERIGMVLCGACLAGLLAASLRHLGFSWSLNRAVARVAAAIAEGGVARHEARRLARHLAATMGGDVEKARAALAKTTLSSEQQSLVVEIIRGQLLPRLTAPVSRMSRPVTRAERFLSEWSRAFVLGLFVFIWFFLVPVPGMLVFTAFGGRISLSFGAVLGATAGLGLCVLVMGCASLILEAWEKRPWAPGNLATRITRRHQAFLDLERRGCLTPLQVAHLFALFTDVQTYFDQRSYAYARRTLQLIEAMLHNGAPSKLAA